MMSNFAVGLAIPLGIVVATMLFVSIARRNKPSMVVVYLCCINIGLSLDLVVFEGSWGAVGVFMAWISILLLVLYVRKIYAEKEANDHADAEKDELESEDFPRDSNSEG